MRNHWLMERARKAAAADAHHWWVWLYEVDASVTPPSFHYLRGQPVAPTVSWEFYGPTLLDGCAIFSSAWIKEDLLMYRGNFASQPLQLTQGSMLTLDIKNLVMENGLRLGDILAGKGKN